MRLAARRGLCEGHPGCGLEGLVGSRGMLDCPRPLAVRDKARGRRWSAAVTIRYRGGHSCARESSWGFDMAQ